jgi:apolipoprotein D and lipocalin family protein
MMPDVFAKFHPPLVGVPLLAFFSAMLSGCGLLWSTSYPPLDVVPSVDVKRYQGVWYEIASIPVSQQKGCFCTKAEYTLLDDGSLRVVNACRKGSASGEVARAEGKAFVVPGSNNAKLRVQFFWPFRGDYWILKLDEEYSYAVVGTPSRRYCWILSRTPTIQPTTLTMLVDHLRSRGFDVSRLQHTEHSCAE